MAAELTNILTEAGTNEVEVLVFQLAGGLYGVNVAKVREIIEPLPVASVAQVHPAVRGIFQLRGHVFPLVDLRRFFEMPPANESASQHVIVTEFNNQKLGFLVDTVDRIHRTSWTSMSESPCGTSDGEQAVTSVLRLGNDLILMLDFERIAFRIAGIDLLERAAAAGAGVNRADYRLLLAEDSALMRKMLVRSLEEAGFGSVTVAHDGEEAWERLIELHESAQAPDLIVTDIEMPRVDGLHLTRRIKQHPQLKSIPVIVFSSLVSDDNLKKCKAVGADRQLTKPELPGLVQIVDELLGSCVPA